MNIENIMLNLVGLRRHAMALSCTLLFAISSSAQGQTYNQEDGTISRLEVFGKFAVLVDKPDTLYFASEITSGDSFDLRRALRRSADVKTLVLGSPGGSVYEALQIAGIVNDLGISTYVPADAVCASACAFIFFAGKSRWSNGSVGVHQFSSDGSDSNFLAQYTVSEIIGFLNSFDTPAFVFERMFATNPEQMYFFDTLEVSIINKDVLNVLTPEIPRIEQGILGLITLLSSAQKLEPATEKPQPRPDQQIIQDVQTELNRIGCTVGGADGKVGQRSRSGLSRFSAIENITPSEDLFVSESFLVLLKAKPLRFCPPLPKPVLVAKLARNWSLDATCNRNTIRGFAELTFLSSEQGDTFYRMSYTNSLSQKWQGRLVHSEGEFLFNLGIVAGKYSNPNLSGRGSVSNNFSVVVGSDSNGCTFQATAR